MNCLKKDGCLKYCRFPDEGEEDSAIPFEEPELMETP